MPPSPESFERLKGIWERRATSLKSWLNPPDPSQTLPADSTFPSVCYGDLVMEERPATTWNDFQNWISDLNGRWSFRGQRKECWRLIPRLEQATETTTGVKTGRRVRTEVGMFLGTYEQDLLHEFQKEAHLHTGFIPGSHETLDWLALMQHHGAPTRLLDWTRSPYVALYFAIETAEKESAVWAIDLEWVDRTSTELLRKYDAHCPDRLDVESRCKYFNNLVFEQHTPWNDHPVVISPDPLRKNERMTAQQGHFLRALDYNTPFDVSLLWMIRGTGDPTAADRPLRKLIVTPCERIRILTELRRMNIHSASLFPGLDGLARSLKIELDIRIVASTNES